MPVIAKKNLYKGSVVRVSASYRPSSKVGRCGEGVWGGAVPPPQVKNIFLYTGLVVRVSASSSFIAVSHLNAHPQSLPQSYLICFSGVL